MYNVLPSFILGFHGCDGSVAERIFAGQDALKPSDNDYDWLGPGIYFWENNPTRALDYARMLGERPSVRGRTRIEKPAVVGAVIDPGHCLNLLDSRSLQIVQEAYRQLSAVFAQAGTPLPENKTVGGSRDLLLRRLDCAVVRFAHHMCESQGLQSFDTVRGMFAEGEALYPGAGFQGRNHVQLCVRDPRRIKGYFRVLPEPRR